MLTRTARNPTDPDFGIKAMILTASRMSQPAQWSNDPVLTGSTDRRAG
jgi:hypothetical protein